MDPVRILYIHQNFPSQYHHAARHFAGDPRYSVAAIADAATRVGGVPPIPGVRLRTYSIDRREEPEAATAERRGLAVRDALLRLRRDGFVPDLVAVHPGWGEGARLAEVFPDTPILAYAEWLPSADDPVPTFDPEFGRGGFAVRREVSFQDGCLAGATRLQTPTRFQYKRIPAKWIDKTVLLHEGIDTELLRPNPYARITIPPADALVSAVNEPLPSWAFRRRDKPLTLGRRQEVVTFASRTLEPCRGWHIFARALPAIQARRPGLHVVVAGRTRDGYGPPPPGGNWRDAILDTVKDGIDFSRLHFVGTVQYRGFVKLLQISRVHVYLTYPFVLSYSPLEAMSCGAPLVVSNTEPILEATTPNNAIAVDFFDPAAVADAVCRLLDDEDLRLDMGRAAREFVRERYDLRSKAIPEIAGLVASLEHFKKCRQCR